MNARAIPQAGYPVFRLVGLIALGFNLLLWFSVRRRLQELFPRFRWARGVRGAAVFAIVFHPALVMVTAGWPGLRAMRAMLPEELLMAGMAVQVACLLWLVTSAMIGLARGVHRGALLIYGRVTRGSRAAGVPAAGAAAPAPHPVAATPPGDVPATSSAEARPVVPQLEAPLVSAQRRRVVAGAALAVPALALAASGLGVIASRAAPSVVRVKLPVRRQMTALHGVSIAQVSDVHVGSYMDVSRLDEIRDAMNSLGADYHVITGDLLDNHVSQLELAAHFVRGLRPRRGEVFLCMGNHEYIAARSASVKTIVRGLEEAGAQVLVDEARELRLGSDRLWMAGIDYPPSARLTGRVARQTSESLRLVLGQMRDDGAPRIVLSHHPRTYVQARELDLDLMLSGHTHGGQIKLGRIGEHALTPVLPVDFYHNGLYRHAQSRLYVNAGAGGWLPVRINCPPEITLVELGAVA